MDYYFWIGIAASIVISVQLFPQIIKQYKTKDASGMSILTLFLMILGTVLWLIYGVSEKDIPILLSNGLIFVCALILIVFKKLYSK
jgi:MtN3 and saliva related transmembrane protein